MKNLLYLFGILLVLSACNTPAPTEQTKECNETERLLAAVAWFQRSAEMDVQYRQAFEFAQIKIERNLAKHQETDKPAAVVLDIDETVLDNSPFEVKAIATKQPYTRKSWSAWVQNKSAKALPGALEFTKWAKEKGVEVFYISNRRTNNLDVTVENLKTVGFPNADSSFVLLRSDKSDKTARRTTVQNTHKIILYIGDNLTDYSEEFRERKANFGKDAVAEKWEDLNSYFIQLPNPMYGDWMSHLQGNRKASACTKDSSIRASLEGF